MRNKRLVRALRWRRVSGAFYKTWARPAPIAVSVLFLLVILAQAGGAVNAESLPDADLARGSVLVEMFEQGVPVEAKWPLGELEASESYAEEALALFRLPQRYVDTGVPLEKLIETVFMRVLTRPPAAEEMDTFQQLLEPGFEGRIVADAPFPIEREPQPYVTWANHLEPEADEIKVRQQQEARAGQPPTQRLDEDWRMRMEDMLWALLNSPEIVLVP